MKVLFLLLISNFSFANVINLYGKAYAQDEKTLLYHEIHEITTDADGYNTFVETRYLEPSLKEFAILKSDFKKNQFVPDSKLVDNKNNIQESLELIGDRAEIKITRNGILSSKKNIETNPDFVAGQGFNNYLIKHLEELAQGVRKQVSFLIIPLQDYFRFEARRIEKPQESGSEINVRIQIASFFLKVFNDPILVKYDKKTKGLLEFRGLSNLNMEKDKKPYVVIKYSNSPPLLAN